MEYVRKDTFDLKANAYFLLLNAINNSSYFEDSEDLPEINFILYLYVSKGPQTEKEREHKNKHSPIQEVLHDTLNKYSKLYPEAHKETLDECISRYTPDLYSKLSSV